MAKLHDVGSLLGAELQAYRQVPPELRLALRRLRLLLQRPRRTSPVQKIARKYSCAYRVHPVCRSGPTGYAPWSPMTPACVNISAAPLPTSGLQQWIANATHALLRNLGAEICFVSRGEKDDETIRSVAARPTSGDAPPRERTWPIMKW